MGTPTREQLQQCMLPSGISHQGSEWHPRKQIDQRFAGESPFVQRKQNNKLFVSSWTRLLGIAFTSLAAAYFLLLCFRLIESARQWAPPARSLSDRQDESCDSGSVSGDDDEDGSRLTGGSAEGLELESFGEGSLLLQHEAFGFKGAAEGTQGEVVAAGLQSPAAGEEAEADYVAAFYEAVREYVGGVASDSEKPLFAHDLHLWESRNMPVEEELRLVRLFKRMHEAVSSCRSLLPVLTRRHRLQLTNQVLKLLALDLGAIYLVREDKERRRKALGDSLIKLAKYALHHGPDGSGSKRLRGKLLTLTSLITELKQPRHLYKEKPPEKYKRKMIAILATAEVALKNCLGVLNGLLQLRQDTSAGQLPPRTVEQQIEVIKSIFRVHADHVARDGSLRQYILECQKRTRVYALLTTDHFKVSSDVILPVKEQKFRILEAVRAAGGLLQAQQQARVAFDSASVALEESRNLCGKHEGLREQRSLKPPQKSFVETLQPSFYATTAAAQTGAESTRPPLAGVPLWRPDRPPRQGAGPVRQQPHKLGSSWNPQDKFPQLVSRPVSLPESRLSKFRPHAPTTGVLGTNPYLPPPQMPFARPPQPSGVQQTARPPHSVSSRQAYAGCSAAASLVSPPPLLRVGVGEPSQQLQPPAPFQGGGYSLFGGGGTPPWLPFSQASPASIERRSTARGGRPQEGEGAQRPMTDSHDAARYNFPSGRTWSGRQ
ncbi:hypothetical protein, conserved [Eimeria tenella]|uniref:Transmembrane protein n=1 Tax=Eimeria tenella TaxID=5802 RepID=U6L3Y8_EIMTE|nr:hypothetical protein, conserved [Eimeria tenella]CDJ42455.1 hypothetical protein, conserved [Eimeria tenella]|eukprot:XP_013233205.1 hypothetical protein, conserved [Eimeria tenella]